MKATLTKPVEMMKATLTKPKKTAKPKPTELAMVAGGSWPNYQTSLETKSIPGMKSPRGFPLLEVLLPIPEAWDDFATFYNISLADEIACLVCQTGDSIEFFGICATPRKGFPAVWEGQIELHLPTTLNLVVVSMVCRVDVWRCLEQAAASVHRTAHEVALAILGHNLPLALELRQACADMRAGKAVPA